MSKQQVSFIQGSNGNIAVYDWCNEQPRYLALLIHGYGEHLGRYQYVADTLTQNGARVFGPDHLGHGLSDGERVLIDDYEAVVDDVHCVVKQMRQKYPMLPFVVIGHSMGGMIAARYVQRYGNDVNALILSAPLLGKRTMISDLAELESIPDTPLDTATLSRDPAVGIDYQNDPLVWHGAFKHTTLRAMQNILPIIDSGSNFGELPTLWIHGSDDRLVLLNETKTTLDKLQGKYFEHKLNPNGQHESFNEINKAEVLTWVTDFIERVLK
ncbi:alpha/beta hydrolase [Phocoenobacter atlanticus]|uniref:alpha/beta hydrolase n=1 Tax=Phocoenobacter atlanticus TaxID=3416742 RepID=UPI0027572CFB|nr:alpha/beta hydrolase [Pasteurella atlantica]MDP8101632.1 lysophospholipase [Pasteurella atlantica]